ncbi:single-stranded DNA-binding protein [Streptomyces sp. CA-294286]|uniref:single-stranded DNA-binding protein n=1 Tax=Streptomyces sp. CA-294286 TaxID=3240070 RepID=UPI003D8DD178
MNETMVTLVGNAASGPIEMETPRGGSVKFRLAVQPRYFHREKETWADGPTSFYTVWTRRTLAANLTSSLSIGEPLIVHGRLRIKEESKGERRWLSAEVEAVAVGHDLNRGTAAFRKVARADPRLVEPAAVRAAEAALWAVESPVSWAARNAPTGVANDPSDGPSRSPSEGVPDAGANEPQETVSAVS